MIAPIKAAPESRTGKKSTRCTARIAGDLGGGRYGVPFAASAILAAVEVIEVCGDTADFGDCVVLVRGLVSLA
jgi:hypothetical protein